MNVQTLKALTWIGALSMGGGLGYEVYAFLRDKPELEGFVTQEEQYKWLRGFEEPAEPTRNLVDYDHVRLSFLDMDWTGREKPKVVIEDRGQEIDKPKPKTPVSKLLTVLVLQVDENEPEGSMAFVKYLAPKLASRNERTRDRMLRVGERLFPPFDNVRVDAITLEGVRFAFDDPEREPELLQAAPFSSESARIVRVDQAIQPAASVSIPVNANPTPYRPKSSVQIGKNEWQIGIETAAEVEQDFTGILARDLQYRTARDSRTGQVVGVQITKVTPGSIPAQHGVTSGEIVKSINGHRVTGVNDAVAFVKKEAESTNTWVVVFEKQGKEFTRVYKSPVE